MGAPPVDVRTADEIASQVQKLLARDVPRWPADAPPNGAVAALIRAFARYAELVLERVNRVPDRNRLAFLQHLGVSPLSARAARAPLTFTLSAGALTDIVVPAGSQVSTAAAPRQEPVVFETDRDLTVSTMRLALAFVKDPEQDRFADRRSVLTVPADPALSIFTGDRLIEHVLYIGHGTFFGARQLDELCLAFNVGGTPGNDAPQTVSWELSGGVGAGDAVALTPSEDGTSGLTRSGRVVFKNVPVVEPSTVGTYTSRWLRARLNTPIARTTVVTSLTLQRIHERKGLRPDAALANAQPLDLTKDFLPLGEQPRFGDVFYLANSEAFSLEDANVRLQVTLTGPAAPVEDRLAEVGAPANLTWEFWNGAVWQELGTGRATQDVQNDATSFLDTTRALTRSGEIRFRLPAPSQPLAVSGMVNFWVRARLTAGGYGEAARYVPPAAASDETQYVYRAPTLAPPSLRSIDVTYSLFDTAEPPETILASNDFVLEAGTSAIRDLKQSFAVFRPTAERRPALYLGLRSMGESPAGGRSIAVYLSLASHGHRKATGPASAKSPVVVWDYWNGSWNRLATRDRTRAMTCSGTIEILLPSDIEMKQEFGETAYWIRALWRGRPENVISPVRRILLNTVDASQAMTIRNEVLGSSNGGAGQRLRATHPGLLDGPRLEVREHGLPAAGAESGAWVMWQEQAGLELSGPSDRHYALNHQSGEVTFGGGTAGLVPQPGQNNIRFAEYRIGGGTRGNVPANTIVQLKSAIPYVESVTNEEPAAGGADPESAAEFRDRAPAILRHQGRAVSAEDYEDLARQASTEVARAKCYPLLDLGDGLNSRQIRPGVVSVIIVPRSEDPQPLPALSLLNDVREFLGARQSPSVKLVVLGPEYACVDVEAQIVLSSLERVSEIEVVLRRALTRFLHPLHGGTDGSGWDFGREPHRSDVYSLLGSIPGIHHVPMVKVIRRENRAGGTGGTAVTGPATLLICPGTFTLWYFAG